MWVSPLGRSVLALPSAQLGRCHRYSCAWETLWAIGPLQGFQLLQTPAHLWRSPMHMCCEMRLCTKTFSAVTVFSRGSFKDAFDKCLPSWCEDRTADEVWASDSIQWAYHNVLRYGIQYSWDENSVGRFWMNKLTTWQSSKLSTIVSSSTWCCNLPLSVANVLSRKG